MSTIASLADSSDMRRRSSGEEVARVIRSWIFEGRLRPGERVPQDQIAESIGVSRIPVREALIALEREGWVRIELHRGAYVNALDEQTVRDHFDLLAIIYTFAARRAVRHLDDDVEAELQERERAVRDADTPEALQRAAIRFNDVVIRAAASPRIGVLLRAVPVLVPAEFFSVVPEAVQSTKSSLAKVSRALRKGDAEAAADAYAKLMRQHGKLVAELFRRQGLFSA